MRIEILCLALFVACAFAGSAKFNKRTVETMKKRTCKLAPKLRACVQKRQEDGSGDYPSDVPEFTNEDIFYMMQQLEWTSYYADIALYLASSLTANLNYGFSDLAMAISNAEADAWGMLYDEYDEEDFIEGETDLTNLNEINENGKALGLGGGSGGSGNGENGSGSGNGNGSGDGNGNGSGDGSGSGNGSGDDGTDADGEVIVEKALEIEAKLLEKLASRQLKNKLQSALRQRQRRRK